MMTYFRSLVSGKKKRYVDEKYNLDLSYITPRIIAMAYPASGIAQIYRNSIHSVASFLKDKHKNYLVINLSGSRYDYSLFDNKVLEFEWLDHHAPPIQLLFEICDKIDKFLKENIENIVAINCLAGKGRTGTIICCYLIYCGRFKSAENAFDYYSKKRFSDGEGVTQPSQRRYVYYFEKILKEKIIIPPYLSLNSILINKFPQKEKDSMKLFTEIYSDNSVDLLYSNKTTYLEQKKIYSNDSKWINILEEGQEIRFCGDITIKVYENKVLSSKEIGRIALNSAFANINESEEIFRIKDIDPDSLSRKIKMLDFRFILRYKKNCNCINKEYPIKFCEICKPFVSKEIERWDLIREILENHEIIESEGTKLCFGDESLDDVNEILNASEIEKKILYQDNEENLNTSFENKNCFIF